MNWQCHPHIRHKMSFVIPLSIIDQLRLNATVVSGKLRAYPQIKLHNIIIFVNELHLYYIKLTVSFSEEPVVSWFPESRFFAQFYLSAAARSAHVSSWQRWPLPWFPGCVFNFWIFLRPILSLSRAERLQPGKSKKVYIWSFFSLNKLDKKLKLCSVY